MIKRHLLSFGLLLLLAGCAIQPDAPPSKTTHQPANWLETKIAVEQINAWTIEGKIGVKQPDRSDSAIINRWQQIEDQFIIELSSTIMGIGSTKIVGSPKALKITDNNDETTQSDNPQLLLYQHTGWILPLDLLPYWVKGIPAPAMTDSMEFDLSGDLASFKQAGWNISLSRFKQINQYRLPGKIKLQSKDVRIILVINEWQLHT